MDGTDLRQTGLDRGPELVEPGMVLAVEFLSLDELPQPLNQIQVGGVRRQVQQGNSQLGGQSLYRGVSLVAGVVQHERDRPHQSACCDLRSSSHIVSVLTTVVFVTAINSRATAFQAPNTLNRCRPDAALTNSRVNDHRQHRKVPNTKCAASTKNTCP